MGGSVHVERSSRFLGCLDWPSYVYGDGVVYFVPPNRYALIVSVTGTVQKM